MPAPNRVASPTHRRRERRVVRWIAPSARCDATIVVMISEKPPSKGLLLDSGDTLMHPRGGRWNPRIDFETVVLRRHPDAPMDSLLAVAIAAGEDFLLEWASISQRIGAAAAHVEYHRVVLRVLGIEPTDELLNELDSPLPFTELVEPFPDTAAGLAALRSDGWAIAIVADTGVAMIDVYRHHGLDAFIDAFVISEELGCTKPDPRMYHAGSAGVGLKPSQCVFVDDRAGNVRAAIALGYGGCAISRYAAAAPMPTTRRLPTAPSSSPTRTRRVTRRPSRIRISASTPTRRPPTSRLGSSALAIRRARRPRSPTSVPRAARSAGSWHRAATGPDPRPPSPTTWPPE